MENLLIRDVLKEIEGYDVNWLNCIEFLFQSKGRGDDFPFFYYKSSLLQLMQCYEHLDKMIAFSCGIEDNDVHSIRGDISKIYNSFIQGNNEELCKVIDLAKQWEEEFDKLYDTSRHGCANFNSYTPEEIEEIFENIRDLDFFVKLKCYELDNIRYQRKKQKEIEAELNDLSKIRLKGIINRWRQYRDKVVEKDEINDKIASLESKIFDYDEKINLKVKELESVFREKGAIKLLEKMNFTEAVLEENDSIVVDDTKLYNRFFNRFRTYFNFVKRYHQLADDICSKTSVIKSYNEIIAAIEEKKDFRDLCLMVRNVLFDEEDLRLRKIGLVANSEFMASTSKSDEVEPDFDKLCILYKDVLQEQNMELFIRKCADFHYDFLRVHPFCDGNGRTARILLVTMLMSRNIMLPSLYHDVYGKTEFYDKETDKAFEGDFRNIEQKLFERLGHYYPIVIPPVPEEKSAIESIDFESTKKSKR